MFFMGLIDICSCLLKISSYNTVHILWLCICVHGHLCIGMHLVVPLGTATHLWVCWPIHMVTHVHMWTFVHVCLSVHVCAIHAIIYLYVHTSPPTQIYKWMNEWVNVKILHFTFRLDGRTSKVCSPQFWMLTSLRARCQQICFLVYGDIHEKCFPIWTLGPLLVLLIAEA